VTKSFTSRGWKVCKSRTPSMGIRMGSSIEKVSYERIASAAMDFKIRQSKSRSDKLK
jgi:hypothetical protein